MDFSTVHARDIKKGDVLWESSSYGNLQFEVLNDPVHNVDRWEWQARTAQRGTVDYVIVDGYEHYGPRIYRNPVYMGVGDEPLEGEKS